jgi:hypothetical protein
MPSCLACRQKGTVSLRKIAVSTCEQEQSLRKLSLQQILRGLFLILINLNRLNDLNGLNLHYFETVSQFARNPSTSSGRTDNYLISRLVNTVRGEALEP